ncbi:MAG: hypothetical protein ACJAXX_002705 [Roseivirga sp.]|jgi:hypothetical protein
MSSVGTYSCTARGAKLEIRAIKNQNSDASGTFSMGRNIIANFITSSF